ncbi:MAG: aminotransferase class I/II-fold pyridoxal phosphate-dependent enzyme [Thermoproteota archaeon]
MYKRSSIPRELERKLFGEAASGLQAFCLERWQSLHETQARVLLSESGVEPLTLAELEELGVELGDLKDIPLGYGWTRGSPELRKAVAGLYGGSVDPEGILVTNGSAEANLAAVVSIVRPGDVVAVDMPNYMQVAGLLRWVGAQVVELWRKPPSWSFPLDEALRVIEERRPKALFVTDPNNPTGSYMSRRELSKLADAAGAAGTLLVFDEVYWGLELEGDRPSVLEVAGPELAVSISGLSKVYGLPGLRIGWLASTPERSERAWSVKDYTTIAPNVLSDFVASKVLSNPRVVETLRERARTIVTTNLSRLEEVLRSIQNRVRLHRPRAGAYALIEVGKGGTLEVAYKLFRDHGILVNPGECFGIPGYLRVGLGEKPEKFRTSAALLAEALDGAVP